MRVFPRQELTHEEAARFARPRPVLQCDTAFASCSCNIAVCSTTAGSDDMDAVEDSTNLGGITATGNTQSATACN
jgi:hypothetical protein